jgi:DNA-directed RNA polymerase subunit L
MEIKVLEHDKDGGKVKIELDDKTLANVLNAALWEGKIDYAAWSHDHPYLSKPVILVKAKDPKAALVAAAEQVAADAEAVKKAFVKAAK